MDRVDFGHHHTVVRNFAAYGGYTYLVLVDHSLKAAGPRNPIMYTSAMHGVPRCIDRTQHAGEEIFR